MGSPRVRRRSRRSDSCCSPRGVPWEPMGRTQQPQPLCCPLSSGGGGTPLQPPSPLGPPGGGGGRLAAFHLVQCQSSLRLSEPVFRLFATCFLSDVGFLGTVRKVTHPSTKCEGAQHSHEGVTVHSAHFHQQVWGDPGPGSFFEQLPPFPCRPGLQPAWGLTLPGLLYLFVHLSCLFLLSILWTDAHKWDCRITW